MSYKQQLKEITEKVNSGASVEIHDFAIYLRANPTYGESLLWNGFLRKHSPRFMRQTVINNMYIADFLCKTLKLIVEIDGESHYQGRYEKDAERQKVLESWGYTVLRVSEKSVLNDFPYVCDYIESYVYKLQSMKTDKINNIKVRDYFEF